MTTVHHKIPRVISENCSTLGDAERLCLVCIMLVRGEQVDRLKAETQRLMDDGRQDQVRWLSSEATRDIFEAVCRGVSHLAPDLGLVPVCWEHLAGLSVHQQPAPTLARANGALPPGLRGKG